MRDVLGQVLIASLMAFAVVGLLVHQGAVVVPNALNPFASLDVRDEPGWLTGYELGRLERDAQECRSVLEGSPLLSSPISDEVTREGCGFSNADEVARSSVRFNNSFPATCPLAVGWALLELHVLQQAARQHLGQEVARVEHLGRYFCRNLYHRESGRRSQYATANAIDIAGFALADSTRISVLADWNGPPAKAAFRRAVRDGACRFFDVVLSRDYNEAHRDHFHFDQGDQSACR